MSELDEQLLVQIADVTPATSYTFTPVGGRVGSPIPRNLCMSSSLARGIRCPTQALLADALAGVMLAHLRSAAFLALALAALVGADARPQALLALAPAAGRSWRFSLG